MQWHASVEATKDKIKEDRFKEWCFLLERRLNEKEKEENDKSIVENFYFLRGKLFETLYGMNMHVNNIEKLYKVLEIFQPHIRSFEVNNAKYGEIYYSTTHSYSLASFKYILFNSIEFRYTEIEKDLSTWYLEQLDKNRIINYNK